ncbi:2-oxo acid dehydrogenase subunit E2 [Azospirillum sp. RWY-5-1]|uniref:Dihydrolipoamide acetyltransferase component of pyruvate dehydrogenase complex n=1 Tax=Azospirillum oleiclasticum TaxID=2735135 RepID=A0ABX2TCS4_9PROT|nr:dihydrolipoamide acetyltransferase family protein [Azospirillum oleiclasticum]NYZ14875.1 2-oxo acid dehydrogenase subunit E2 [Azospirillum oleiclasticum]NYZ22139.1 2-oxo acid dehydrogenase subunit E2 [Azospirillum oleiclasticum]
MGLFRMPSLGADMEAGTLVEWLKRPGDAIRRGDIVAVVETQKGAIEVETFEDGVIERLLVAPGTTVPVGTPLATLAGEEAAVATMTPAMVPVLEIAAAPAASPPQPPAGAPTLASPAARRLAAERGIELAGLAGSGPGGAVRLADVERAAPRRAAGIDLADMRRAITAAMARSKREIPHYYLGSTIDLTNATAWLARTNADRAPEERLLLAALELKAVALALRRHPRFNGHNVDGDFRPGAGIHVGAAVAIRGGGLAAPAIRDTDTLGLDDLMARLRDLVGRTRAGHLRSSELGDATITVTSLGERGVDSVFGVIYPPQVAIVGFGRPVERPWAVSGRVELRTVVTATLAADHRVSDGHAGALFLAEIDRLLQEPDSL